MKKLINDIVNGTLKRYDSKGVLRYSRTSLTMFTAWISCLLMSYIDFIQNGLRFDVWTILIGVAIGSKLSDAYSQKIKNKTNESNISNGTVE